MSKNTTYLGYIGGVRVWLDFECTGAAQPALLLDNTQQGERLAALLSPDPLVLDQFGDTPVLRVEYTPALDSLIVELINVLGSARYAAPGLVQMALLDEVDHAAR